MTPLAAQARWRDHDRGLGRGGREARVSEHRYREPPLLREPRVRESSVDERAVFSTRGFGGARAFSFGLGRIWGWSCRLTRDARGRFKRCWAEREAFEQSHPCPATGLTSGACPGYVVDHIIPLKRGGADTPSNMQWQTVAEAKLKDRIE